MPIRDTEDHLVAVLHLRVILTREEYVHRQLSRIGAHKDCCAADLCHTYILFIATLQHLCDSSLGVIARTQSLTLQDNLHAVALQSVVYITLIYIYIILQLLHTHIRSPRGYHIHRTLIVRQLRCRELILLAAVAHNNTLLNKCIDQVAHHISRLLGIATRSRHQLLHRELAVGELAKHIDDKCCTHLL